ncbi:carbohydrate kinase family protein [Candidatus Uhrbacteria bacterium]|nr:carbohydrate kinase family protein [Candidatus Uhrbacteria bacterium]
MFDVITIGSATRDVFLFVQALHPHRESDAVSKIEACLPFGAKIDIERLAFDTGGGATNSAATFARLGKFEVAALTRIGQDSRGQSILKVLHADNIDTSLVQVTNKDHTAYSSILSPTHAHSERTILVYRGASSCIESSKIPWTKLRAKWFYISSLGGDLLLLKKLIDHARRIKAQVAWNPGGQELSKLTPPLRLRGGWEGLRQSIDFLILNREEAAKLTGKKFDDTKGLLRALARTTHIAVMTDGPKGAYAIVGSQSSVHSSQYRNSKTNYPITKLPNHQTAYFVPSVGHKPENLTGAGDAFGSGFVTGWIKSRGDIKYALRLASFNADSVVQHVGAKNGILEKIPSAKQLQKLPVKTLHI